MSDRTHLRPLSPAKRIEQLEAALEATQRALEETRAVLADCREGRDLPLWEVAVEEVDEGENSRMTFLVRAVGHDDMIEVIRETLLSNYEGFEGDLVFSLSVMRVRDDGRRGILGHSHPEESLLNIDFGREEDL